MNPSNTGSGFEFQVIAAVVIGGVSINGGVGTVLGTVLGVLLLGCVAAALPLLGIPGTSQAAIYGAVILVALRHRPHRAPAGRPQPQEGTRMSASDAPMSTAPQDAAVPRPRWQVLLIRPETMTFILLVLGIFAADCCRPSFSTSPTSCEASPCMPSSRIVALVLTLVIIAGEIDLSPAANMALSACIFAWAQQAGVPIPLAIVIGLASGLLMGAFNGVHGRSRCNCRRSSSPSAR